MQLAAREVNNAIKITRAVALVSASLFLGTTRLPAQSTEQADKNQYLKHAFSPFAAMRAAAGAGIEQARNVPHEWGQGTAGFAKRVAASFGKHLVNHSIHYVVAKMRHEEFGYRASGKEGFGPRLKYALVSTVITHKTTDGSTTVSMGELSGAFGSGLISRAWQPASTRSIALGFGSGGITLGVDAASHVVREFWPEIRHPHSHSEKGRPAPVQP